MFTKEPNQTYFGKMNFNAGKELFLKLYFTSMLSRLVNSFSKVPISLQQYDD